jgi:thermostable 8-oxoguanine DNA glycosylase
MRDKGVDTPKATPSGARYLALENIAIALFESYFGKNLDLADIDLLIWKAQSGR